ncbi:MAG: AAA family ATPase [Lentimicrobiaceae bacterium]|jgi:predicted AAA+ superfamily ATPase|nr:AAA family ATPase [Lentimicrobiaceae bacterium]
MDALFEKSYKKLNATSLDFERSLMDEIEWNARLIGIRGARGVGKTTLLLQYLKHHLPLDGTALYLSLDDLWFAEHKLWETADLFVKRGGKYLFLDEVHKYPNWAQEIKNIYDDFAELKVVFTGSSLLEILNARADLSRRAIVYEMQGLSFREYLNITQKLHLPVVSLNDIIQNQLELSSSILNEVKPLQFFSDYLRCGYYPFFNEMPSLYYDKMEEMVNMILEIELPLLRGLEIAYVYKIKQLLSIIAASVPFVPNVSKISERIGINRITLLSYLHYLEETKLTKNIHKDIYGINRLQKPEKIYLENTNLAYALSERNTDMGNLRETFFLNQVSYHHTVEYPNQGDFWVDKKYLFEIGGKSKTNEQIRNVPNAFIVADNIEYGIQNKIPLWMFGFLY